MRIFDDEQGGAILGLVLKEGLFLKSSQVPIHLDLVKVSPAPTGPANTQNKTSKSLGRDSIA